MNFKNLSGVAVGEKAPKTRVNDSKKTADTKKIKDARMVKLRKRIKDSIEDTESTEEAIAALTPYLESDDPTEVLETIVAVFAETIDALEALIVDGAEEEEEEEAEV